MPISSAVHFRQQRTLGENVSTPGPQLAQVKAILVSSASIKEGTAARFQIVREVNLDSECTVVWTATSAGGSADLSGTVTATATIAKNVAQVDVSVQTVKRANAQGDRRLDFTLSSPGNCIIASGYSQASLTIQDDTSTTSGNKSKLPWKSGARLPNPTASSTTKNFEDYRGRKMDLALGYIDQSQFDTNNILNLRSNSLTRSGGTMANMLSQGFMPVLSIPLLVTADDHAFTTVKNSADYVTTHQAMADQAKARMDDAGYNGICPVRLGWEANSGYIWSFDGGSQLSDYPAAWRKMALIWKNTDSRFRLVWNHLKKGFTNADNFYPGSDCVDILSLDFYDNGDGGGGYCTSESIFQRQKGSWNLSQKKWSGWGGFIDYAKYIGKRVAFDEWGFANDCETLPSATCGANNDFFMGRWFSLCQDLAADTTLDPNGMLVYECVFDTGKNNKNMFIQANGQVYTPSAKCFDAYKAAYTP